MEDTFYRHLGVYGICFTDEKILLIRKSLGPYTGKFDLPGGRLEASESLAEALKREVKEETGYTVNKCNNIGVCDYSVLWTLKDNSTEVLQHIAILYEITIDTEEGGGTVDSFEGQDSKEADWLPFNEITSANSSPLVQQAIEWIHTKTIPIMRGAFDYRTII